MSSVHTESGTQTDIEIFNSKMEKYVSRQKGNINNSMFTEQSECEIQVSLKLLEVYALIVNERFSKQ